jgi:hypothetical protein
MFAARRVAQAAHTEIARLKAGPNHQGLQTGEALLDYVRRRY